MAGRFERREGTANGRRGTRLGRGFARHSAHGPVIRGRQLRLGARFLSGWRGSLSAVRTARHLVSGQRGAASATIEARHRGGRQASWARSGLAAAATDQPSTDRPASPPPAWGPRHPPHSCYASALLQVVGAKGDSPRGVEPPWARPGSGNWRTRGCGKGKWCRDSVGLR